MRQNILKDFDALSDLRYLYIYLEDETVILLNKGNVMSQQIAELGIYLKFLGLGSYPIYFIDKN